MKVTRYTRRQTFNEARSILRDAMETGESERIGLPREFIIALTKAGRADRTRSPSLGEPPEGTRYFPRTWACAVVGKSGDQRRFPA
ncbi:hypothetical protein AB0M39_18810 [Streptomyces sp. NPDC051907]|uniref:hypothetical protein n=1 Tax=Streptomyces sp. NPDC051907 TaxID=3155284 RepID=UPI003436FB43